MPRGLQLITITLVFLCMVVGLDIGRTGVDQDRNPTYGVTEQVRYSLPDSTEGLSWAIVLLAYPALRGIEFPVDTVVTFESCDGDVNAYYFSGTHNISVCYPLLDYFASIMSKEEALAATMWTIGHELGHAVVDFKNIPVIRGEDVADSYAVWSSTEAQSEAAMLWFRNRMEEDDYSSPDDSHSFAAVRYYNIQCWLYGKTGEMRYFVSPWNRDCEGEWQAIDQYWTKALASSP